VTDQVKLLASNEAYAVSQGAGFKSIRTQNMLWPHVASLGQACWDFFHLIYGRIRTKKLNTRI